MGGIEGRAYKPSALAQSRYNSDLRYYQKYIKPQQDKQIDVGKLTTQALGFSAGIATSYDPRTWVDYAEKAGQIYDWADPRNYEAQRMANNAPGDLSGKTYKGPTKIYN
jgi:hypothetical protein